MTRVVDDFSPDVGTVPGLSPQRGLDVGAMEGRPGGMQVPAAWQQEADANARALLAAEDPLKHDLGVRPNDYMLRKAAASAPFRAPVGDDFVADDFKLARPAQADVRRTEPAMPERTFEQMQEERARLEKRADEMDKAIANLERTVPLREGPAQDAALAKIEQFKARRAELQQQIDRTGVGSTGETVGGIAGAVAGGLLGTTISPVAGTIAGSAGGTALGAAIGSKIDLERAKRNAVKITPEEASKYISDRVVDNVLWDVGGSALFFVGGKVLKLAMNPELRAKLLRESTEALTAKRADVAGRKASEAVEEIFSPSAAQQTPNQQLVEDAATMRAREKAVQELSARSGGAVPSVGQVTGDASLAEKTARALHPRVFEEAGGQLERGAEQMRRELVSPQGQPTRKEIGTHLKDTAKKLEADVKASTRDAFTKAGELNVKVDLSPLSDRIDAELAKDAAGAKRLLTTAERADLEMLRKELDDRMAAEGFPSLLDAGGKKMPSTAKPRADFTAEGTLDFISGNKARTRQLSDGSKPSKYFAGVLGDLNDVAEAAYEQAARRSGNKSVHDNLLKARAKYKDLMGVRYSDDMAAALDKNPEDVGRVLWSTGNVSELENLQSLTNLAVKQGTLTKAEQQAMHADMMRGYLAEAVQNIEAGAKWSATMKDPRKKDTYDAFRAMTGTGDLAHFMEVFEQAAKIAKTSTEQLAPGLGTIGNLPGRSAVGLALGFLSATKASVMLGGAGLAKAAATAMVNGNKGVYRDIMLVMRASQMSKGQGAITVPVREALTRISKFAAENGIEDPVQTVEGEQ